MLIIDKNGVGIISLNSFRNKSAKALKGGQESFS